MEQWQLALAVLGLVGFAIGGAFTLGRMWPRAARPKDSSARTGAVRPEFEHETRSALSQILERVIRIEMTFKDHPTWERVQAFHDASNAKVDALIARVAKLEFEIDGTDRRKAGGS